MKNKLYSPKSGTFSGLTPFLLLWATQGLSSLGSAMTSFALIIWSYQQQGSALTTALLAVCSYAPYVVLSIFAGALSDRWDKKRTMLLCDAIAAASTLGVLLLYGAGTLQIWHLYVLNAVNGLMNTLQQPTSDVAVSLLAPKEQYQRVSGLQSLSNSLVTILAPALASAVLAFCGMNAVFFIDLISFAIAFTALAGFLRIPHACAEKAPQNMLQASREGLAWLFQNRGVLYLMLFLAAINFTASVHNAVLPAMALSRASGGETALGLVNMCAGLANVAGSLLVSLCPALKSRVRVICNTLLLSMGVENVLLALGRTTWVWCLGALLGWLLVPVMSANLAALMRLHIPVELQGRVYAARNTLQFFTIPVGYLLGGVLVDNVFEPLMAVQVPESPLVRLFGAGKGAGAAALFLVLAVLGELTCLLFRRNRHIWALEREKREQEQA